MEIQSTRRLWPICVAIVLCLAVSGCDTTPATTQSPRSSDAGVTGKSQEAAVGGSTQTSQSDLTAGAKNADTTPQSDSTGNSEAITASEQGSGDADQTAGSSKMSSEAFRMAALEGRNKDVERALDNGMNIEAVQPGRGHTALHMASYNGHTDTVLLLIKRGAVVDSRDYEGKTPLIHACTGPYAETVNALLKAGADVNAKDSTEGFTPLMMAAGLDQLEIVKILLASKADKDAVDTDNDKAIDHARRENLSQIVELLN
jgi:ankyrin repeat protein